MIEIVGTLGWILGALAIGLWWGERGRRLAAERYLTRGTPEESATGAVSRAPAREAEDRWLQHTKEAEEAAVERIADGLMEEAASQNLHLDKKQALEDARQMLAGFDVEGPP